MKRFSVLLMMSASCLMSLPTYATIWAALLPKTKSEKLAEAAAVLALQAQQEREREEALANLVVMIASGTWSVFKHTVCLPVTLIRALDDSSRVSASDVLKGLAAAGVTAGVVLLIKEWIRLQEQQSVGLLIVSKK